MSASRYAPGHFDGDGCTFPDPGHFADYAAEIVRDVLTWHQWQCDGSIGHREKVADAIAARLVGGAPPESDTITWTMPREDARHLLRWLRHNRPLGMPDETFDGLVDALATRVTAPGVTE